jgi:hypothetical protein
MKRTLWLPLLALLAAGSARAQPPAAPHTARSSELAEACWLVGRQYALQGEQAKAREFTALAFRLDPRLEPASLAAEAGGQPSGGQPGGAPAPEAPEATAALLQSRFLRLLSAFLSEDTPAVLSLLDGSLWLSRFGGELSRQAIAAELRGFFARADLSGGLAPSAVFAMDGLEVSPLAGPPAWGPCYAVVLSARADFSEALAFWEKRQQYLFHLRDGKWLLFAVGSAPADWSPKAPPAEEAGASAQTAASAASLTGPGSERRSIREAFLASLGRFLQRQPVEASRYFAREILVLRLNATLTREEMAATFEGYFEGADFGGLTAEQVVDAASISVEPSERFGREGEHRLSVRTRLDLSERIPFWTRFQEYYFSREEGDWRIFAIF